MPTMGKGVDGFWAALASLKTLVHSNADSAGTAMQIMPHFNAGSKRSAKSIVRTCISAVHDRRPSLSDGELVRRYTSSGLVLALYVIAALLSVRVNS